MSDTITDIWRMAVPRHLVTQGPFTWVIVDGNWKDGSYVCDLRLQEIRLTQAEYDRLTETNRELWDPLIRIVETSELPVMVLP